MSQSLEISREGRVLRLTLNDPASRDALGADVCRSLANAFEEAGEDSAIGAILLDAKGEFFSSGLNVDELLDAEAPDLAAIQERSFTVGARIRKPVVAAVQGPAISGGLGLVANAHVAVAAQGASFGLTDIRIGIWPFVVFRAVALALGERRALELSLTGRIFSAPEAVQWGLIQYTTPAFELEDRAMEVAGALAAASPHAIHHGMDFAHRIRGMNSGDAGDLAIHLRSAALKSPDVAEGVRALREKRAPRWPSLGEVAGV